MNSNPTVSVVMPHYNRASTVITSIQSVICQTYQDWELIIVDDASKDIQQLREIVQDIADSRIKLVEHEINKNGAQARNTAIDLARGKYLAFLDSDDLWQPDKLQIQVELLAASEVNKVIYTQLKCYNSNTPEVFDIRPAEAISNATSLGDYLFTQSGVMQTSSLLLHTEFARQIMFNPDLRRHQDYDFLLRAESLGAEFTFVREPLVDYIWMGNENIASKSISVERSLFWLTDYRKYLSESAEFGFLNKEVVNAAIRSRTIKPLLQYIRRHKGIGAMSVMMLTLGRAAVRLIIAKLKRALG